MDVHSYSSLLCIVCSSSMTNFGARHHHDSPCSSAQSRRGRESSTQNLRSVSRGNPSFEANTGAGGLLIVRRSIDPLAHQTSLTIPNGAPSAQQIPPILVPDLTGLITRCSQDPVAGGTYGNIYKCIYHGPDGDIEVAVKAFRPHIFSAEAFRRELGIWKRLRHSNILKFMGTTRNFGPSEALVAPWVVNGTLTSFLNQNNESLALPDLLLLLRDIAAGLDYLHAFSITVDGHVHCNPMVHGDLTGSNVLIGSDGTAYLADFGLSGILTKLTGMTYLEKNCCPGALRWTAPELLSEEELVAVTTQGDIYSFGSIMLQVLTGKVPWPHLTRDAAIWRKLIFEGETHPRPADNRITDQHWSFMTSCWSRTPVDRPSAEEAMQFVDNQLVLYDQGSVDARQHFALVPVSGYTPPLIGPVGQSPPFVSPSAGGRCALYE
ncbi:kinase-like domain-containing protein [Suillus lakei]|nr:kinase-like domain-containing protein [Suillus lakei]